MNLRQVAERVLPHLPQELKELRAHVNEFLPFRSSAPVDELVAQAALFLSRELGDELIHIQHFGSTAYTDGRPHRGSDIDLAVVVKDHRDVKELRERLHEAVRGSTLSPILFQFMVVEHSMFENCSSEIPSEAVIYEAKYRGKPVPIPRLSTVKTSKTLE